MTKEVFLQDFIVLTVFIISVHFRYIYSTNCMYGQGFVRFVNLQEKYSYSQSCPGLGRLIVKAEVRTSFVLILFNCDTIKILNLNLRHRSILLLKTTLRTKSSWLCARALKDAAGPGIDTVSVQAAATTTLESVSTH